MAVLLTEHRLDDVFPVADRVVTMERGRILSDGAPGEIAAALSDAPERHRIYFGLPASVRIFGALDTAREQIPLTVRDARQALSDLLGNTGGVIPDVHDRKKKAAERKPTIALGAKDLWFRYAEKGKDVLRGADVTVYHGELLCLLGGNGAGKTTLLNVLAGTARAYRGKVKTEKGGRLCMLPQNVRSLFVADTVRQELLDSAEQDMARAQSMAVRLELDGLMDRHPYDLSGGESQRLAVGKLLLRQGTILLLDEPTKGLDAYAKRQLAMLLQSLCRDGVSPAGDPRCGVCRPIRHPVRADVRRCPAVRG